MITLFNDEMSRDDRILTWARNADILKQVKDVEMKQRKALYSEIFPEPVKGTNKLDLGAGYTLKTVFGYESKMDETSFALIQPEIEKLGDAAKAEMLGAVKYKATLVMKGYSAMSDEVKAIFDECVVTTPKSITLELVTPKVL